MRPDGRFPIEAERCRFADRYELGPLIGIGSSAVVYRARDLRDGVAVAVKQFHPGASAYDLRQQRQEMAALARLHHPGLVALRDGGTAEGRPFVVLDLVEGPSLAERIVAGPPLTPEAVRSLGAQLADALAHVHAAGIVHRDVKPANVLLGSDDRPRLADFGIARALDGTAATATGCVVGTAAYLAPEQVRGESVGPPTDVYALGLVLLEAVTGRREYPGLAVESATARLHRPPTVPGGLPGGLDALLAAMTRDDPERRPTAAVVAAALLVDTAPAAGSRPAVAGALPVDPDPAGGTRPQVALFPQRRPVRHRISATLVGAAVLAVVAGGAAALSGAATPATPAPVAVEEARAGTLPAAPAPAPDGTPPAAPEPVAVERPAEAGVPVAEPGRPGDSEP